jgi:hypothetical protein
LHKPFFQTLGKFDQNASQKESVVTFLIGVFFGILLLQQYNQTRYFSLPYAMLVSIFMILGAIGLFMGLTFHVLARLKAINGK